jgi:D-lactate dehydrogenase
MAYLRQFPNVIFTPHMAFYTQLSLESMMQVGMDGLVELVNTGHTKNEITA